MRRSLLSIPSNTRDLGGSNIITPKIEYMEKFLNMFLQRYNLVEQYFTQIGLSDREMLQLKIKLKSNVNQV